MRDGCQTVMVKQGISFRTISDNTPVVSAIIDTQGYEWCIADIQIGAIDDANATFTVLIEDGDNAALADAAPVADQYLISQTDGIAAEVAASFAFDSDGQVRKLEVQSPKRYVRATITPANNTGAAFFGLLFRLGAPQGAVVVQTAT
jgi:hypothetical protein